MKLCGALLLLAGCSAPASAGDPPLASALPRPQGFPELVTPESNLPTAERIELGRALFYDERLSRSGDVACASCHLQANAFADPNPQSHGVEGRLGKRNASALINEAWGKSFFWDGRALELDDTLEEVARRLNDDAALLAAFQRAYASPPTPLTIPQALASFVRSLISSQSRYDAFKAGDTAALTEEERRGEQVFNGERGECFHCHVGYNLTSQGYRNDGIASDDPDSGRFELTQKESDRGKFKTPTLRNIAVTAPYMHDGSLATLEAVVEQYDAGGRGHENTDPLIQPLALDASEKSDLVAFLRALTDDEFLTNPAFADPEP
jgi:cytochrome c peroxidase